jgi:hypothetical protein
MELEPRGLCSVRERCELAFSGKLQRLLPGDFNAFETVVRLDLLLHLLLDARKVLRRDPVRQVEIVIKAVLDRRTGGKLRLRPDAQDRRGKHVRTGMTKGFNFSHRDEELTTEKTGNTETN